MSREIKFRAWNPESKYMSKGFALDFFIFEGPSISKKIIMQYTGLHDKNDNEIYEGDIVNLFSLVDSDDDGIFDTREIYYNNELMCFMAESGLCGYDLENYDLEVIGNIYENPELLENINE